MRRAEELQAQIDDLQLKQSHARKIHDYVLAETAKASLIVLEAKKRDALREENAEVARWAIHEENAPTEVPELHYPGGFTAFYWPDAWIQAHAPGLLTQAIVSPITGKRAWRHRNVANGEIRHADDYEADKTHMAHTELGSRVTGEGHYEGPKGPEEGEPPAMTRIPGSTGPIAERIAQVQATARERADRALERQREAALKELQALFAGSDYAYQAEQYLQGVREEIAATKPGTKLRVKGAEELAGMLDALAAGSELDLPRRIVARGLANELRMFPEEIPA